jgi:cytoplasmic iron level regulating protein YaaA (DUF328/UPF0246 family)
VIVLLPPSETKRAGGDGPPLAVDALSWPELGVLRNELVNELVDLAADPRECRRALGISPAQDAEIERNAALLSAPTLPALRRYTGVLYDALSYQTLSANERALAGSRVFVQSALFGLISGATAIPWYRLSATSSLPGLNLSKIWSSAHQTLWQQLQGPFLDLRSKAYAVLAPVPQQLESYQLEVLDANSGRALNHFNKKAKGAFTRSLLSQPATLAGAAKAATAADLKLEIDGSTLRLIVPTGY